MEANGSHFCSCLTELHLKTEKEAGLIIRTENFHNSILFYDTTKKTPDCTSSQH